MFTENIRVSDPSGQKLQGKMMYSQMYRLLRGMSSLALRNDSTVDSRLFYDEANAQIKVKVDAELRIAGGSLVNMQRNNVPLHLSIVSYYKLDRASGRVNHHLVERVDLDGTSLEPFRFLSADRDQLLDWVTTGGRAGVGGTVGYPTTIDKMLDILASFQGAAAKRSSNEVVVEPQLALSGGSTAGNAAVAMIAAAQRGGAARNAMAGMGGSGSGNAPRSLVVMQATSGEQKFDVYGNLIPPGREDGLSGKVRSADGQRINPDSSLKGGSKKNPGLLDFIKTVVDKSTPKQCEADDECPERQRCCNFGFANVCCSGGLGVGTESGLFEPAYQPVPVPINDGRVGGGGAGLPPQDLPDFGGLPTPRSY